MGRRLDRLDTARFKCPAEAVVVNARIIPYAILSVEYFGLASRMKPIGCIANPLVGKETAAASLAQSREFSPILQRPDFPF